MIDYETLSTTASGGKSPGTFYIRGIKAKDKNSKDAIKIVMEKAVDFCELDS
jgi:hypothetical protein